MQLRFAIRLFHTVRFLKCSQIAYRLYYRVARVRYPTLTGVAVRSWAYELKPMPWGALSTLDAVNFRFLGEVGVVRDAVDWQATKHSKLWVYNLHYLNDLNTSDILKHPGLADQLVASWAAANPRGVGQGWEPYPLSLRIVNLVKWFARADVVSSSMITSLAEQANALSQQVEYHILGNHVFANAKALVFAGAFLEGSKADRWLADGLRILDAQIAVQFLDDGGHFELSPMYHSTLLWDMCDLVNLAQSSSLPALCVRLTQWVSVIERGLRWMNSMLHPDGKISFFNDAAFGIAPDYSELSAYACKLGISSEIPEVQGAMLNSASGYATFTGEDGVKALLDLAAVGPDYQPGHAHADTLSFELSVFNRRLVVNSGTSVYGEGGERQRQRSTAAHSTVEVARKNSSEVWAGFRVARRARALIEEFSNEASVISIQGCHDGYSRLPGRHLHRRRWQFTNRCLTVKDDVTGVPVRSISRLYFHPDIRLTQDSTGVIAEMPEGQRVSITFNGASEVQLVSSTWHPEFGVVRANWCVEAAFEGCSLVTCIRWSSM